MTAPFDFPAAYDLLALMRAGLTRLLPAVDLGDSTAWVERVHDHCGGVE